MNTIKIEIYVKPDLDLLKKSIEEGYAEDILSIEYGNKRYELYADDGIILLTECIFTDENGWETHNVYNSNYLVFEEAETFNDIVSTMINYINDED